METGLRNLELITHYNFCYLAAPRSNNATSIYAVSYYLRYCYIIDYNFGQKVGTVAKNIVIQFSLIQKCLPPFSHIITDLITPALPIYPIKRYFCPRIIYKTR